MKPPTRNFKHTHIPPPTFSNNEYQYDMSNTQLAFAFFSTYILFPLLYIIISTGNIHPIMILWNFIQSGIFNTVHAIKEFLTDIVYSSLRMFGQYTFSTYTVVKNGREIYTASSMCFYKKSDVKSVYRIDRAKYNICKWIDRQCKQYRLDNHGEKPELTETHNDIYDFIIHKVDNDSCVRIHRGDFSGRTHTLYTEHYRSYRKSNQVTNQVEFTICLPSTADEEPTPETFFISLKKPCDFLVEKNEILDKKFLQWKMYNEYGRADIANYIGQPFSKYSLTIFHHDDDKLYSLNDSHSIIIGDRYIVKVDSVLRCPVIESNENHVYDIDATLTSYYDCSDSNSESSSDDFDTDADADTDADTDADADADAAEVNDQEFEIIEDPITESQ